MFCNIRPYPAAVVACASLLFGCTAIVEVQLAISDLNESRNKEIRSDLYLEIPGCSDSDDSRKPSDSLMKAQGNVPRIFPGAQYVECFSKDFDTLAHFKIPVAVNPEGLAEDVISIRSTKDSLLIVDIPPSVNRNMEAIKKETFGMDSFDLDVRVQLKNDTTEPLEAKVLSAYVDSEPVVNETITIPGQATATIRLANVGVDRALLRGSAPVLLRTVPFEPKPRAIKPESTTESQGEGRKGLRFTDVDGDGGP